MIRSVFFLFILLISVFSNGQNLEIKIPVEKFQLKNGLTVLLQQDRTIPMVSYHTWYRVGSRDEQIGVTGAAHMLEHMMFKGAKKYDNKMFEKILHENGIQNNAFTTSDYTGFYENLPSSKLELIMDIEVDRMRFLSLKPDHLTSELQVVGEERRWRVDNNPTSLLREVMMDVLYKVHPYRWPVIGYMKDIQAYTVEKLKHFYDTYYVPNNAVLVIAGDIDIEKTKSLVEKYYSPLEAKPLPVRTYPVEPEPEKEQRVTTQGEVQNSTLITAYKSVPAGHEDGFALDLLANILGSGSSSRLHKRLVYQTQKAVATSAYNYSSADPGIFFLVASMKPKVDTKIAETIFEEELQKIRNKHVSDSELEKAKNQVMKEFVDGLTTIDGKAQALAINEILFKDYTHLFSDLEKYNKVTTNDIQRVAKIYLTPQRRVIAVLNPKKSGSL